MKLSAQELKDLKEKVIKFAVRQELTEPEACFLLRSVYDYEFSYKNTKQDTVKMLNENEKDYPPYLDRAKWKA